MRSARLSTSDLARPVRRQWAGEVEGRRIERVLTEIAAQPHGSLADRLCAAAETGLDASGVGVALSAGAGLLATVCTTEGARAVEALQVDLGEGPAFDTHRSGWPVLVADLDADLSWPVFAPAALALGLRATFAFPLRRGAVRLGALSVHRSSAGGLSDEEHADALVLARLALDLFLALQSGQAPDELHGMFLDGAASTAALHQATGILSVQLGIAVGAALALLRAHAYAEERDLRHVADDVVARRLRLDRSE
jgi:hypothetical protein